jgi:aerobic carbon-monoxide dehydrogenase small subunit
MEMLELKVNGRTYRVEVGGAETLLEVLRERLRITSPKVGCNTGDCGTCSVIVDGKLVRACLTAAMTVNGKEVVTVEGIAPPGELHPLQTAFHNAYATQCGFCTSGMIMAGKALLDENPAPTRGEVREAISGNLCRCTGYVKIVDAIMNGAEEMSNKEKP